MLIKPGTEGLVIDGLVKATMELDLVDEESVDKTSAGICGAQAARWHPLSLEQLAAQNGSFRRDNSRDAATIFAEAPRSIILCAEGIVRQPNGYQNVLKLIDLAWITGKLGRPGCGVNTVTEEPNEQGAVDMGVAPEFLPGQASFDDQACARALAKAWDVTLPATRHRRASRGDPQTLPERPDPSPLCHRREPARHVTGIDGSPRRVGSTGVAGRPGSVPH